MNTCSPSTIEDWRDWLAQHGRTEREVWVVIQRKGSGTPGLRYHEAMAKASGTWQVVPDADPAALPGDLQERLDRNDAADANFLRFPRRRAG